MQHYIQREWAQKIVATCTYPEQAFANWMQRDISFAAYVAQKALEQRAFLMHIDGSHSLEETVEIVERHMLGI